MKRFYLLAAAASILVATSAFAQDPAANYPNKPVRVVVANPAGGGVDTVTRIIAEGLRQKLKQPFVVENRGGGGGNIGAEMLYTSKPDGYLLMTSAPSPITTNVFLYKKLSFDPSKFEFVDLLGSYPNTLLVRKDFPAKTVQEFIAYVKAHPGKVNYASQGVGTTSHLTAELFDSLMHTKMVHVPYRGTSPALNDIIAGHVDIIFMQLSAALPLQQANKARILAVTTRKRLDVLPDMPTMIEAGLPDFVSDTWQAMSAPPGTPASIVTKLNRAINQVIQEPQTQQVFKRLHVVGIGSTPAETKKFIQDETKRWGEVIKKAGIKPR